MSLEKEIIWTKTKRNTAVLTPVVTATLGGLAGIATRNVVNHYNNELENIENNIQATLEYYRAREKVFEQKIDSIPGLNTWKNTYERIFGETQEAVGINEIINSESTTTLTRVSPEDISLKGLKIPEGYIDIPLLGLVIGLTYGIKKTLGNIRQYQKEIKIMKRLK